MLYQTKRMEREIVLAHVQNLVLCLRSSQINTSRTNRFSYGSNAGDHSEQDFLACALSLQSRLLSGCPTDSIAASALTHSPAPGCEGQPCGDASHSTVPGTTLSEDEVLDVFCQVCISPDTTETMTNVALAGLVAIVELPCLFLSAQGLEKISLAAAGAKSEIFDKLAHETLLGKVADVFVACAHHPASSALSEQSMCRMMVFLLAISADRRASPLLRRLAEKSVSTLVRDVFVRTVATLGGDGTTAGVKPVPTGGPCYGCLTLGLMSMLIAGDVVGFDGTGDARLADGRLALESVAREWQDGEHAQQRQQAGAVSTALKADATADSLLPPSPVAAGSPGKSPATSNTEGLRAGTPSSQVQHDPVSPKSPSTVASRYALDANNSHKGDACDIVALQLEGLHMTQVALTVLGDILNRCESAAPTAARTAAAVADLVIAVQHSVSRALLIAGVSTTQVVVLSQILRTVHMTVRCASRHLVPQVLCFLRVLHLNQLTSLSESIRAAEAGLPVSLARRVGSPLYGPPGSPASTGGSNAFLSTAQVSELHERRVLLLESLAEFCSDPNLCYFCFINYDLSWQYAPVLQALCDALASYAAPAAVGGRASAADATAGKAAKSIGGNSPPVNDRATKPTPLRPAQSIAVDASLRLIRGLTCPREGTLPPPTINQIDSAAVQSALSHAQSQKQLLHAFATAFEEAPLKKGISFLITNSFRAERGREHEVMREKGSWLVIAEPAGGREIGECLFRLGVVLSKRALGEYIGELGRELHETKHDEVDEAAAAAALAQSKPDDPEALIPGTVLFFHHQLLGYMQQFDFRGTSLLRAIREMVFQLSLPGESQKIDRIMEAFAHHWFVQNPVPEADKTNGTTVNPFHSENGAFVLSFAIIMLNTDLHSGKLARNMAPNDFKMMNRGIDDERDVPEAYLAQVYEDVQQHEIIMADMLDRGFANDVTWDLQMRGSRGLSHMHDAPATLMATLHYEPHLCSSPSWDSVSVPQLLNAPIVDILHAPCLRILSGSLEVCGELLDLEAPGHEVTVLGALTKLRGVHPREVDTFLNALNGIAALADVGVQSSQPDTVDEAMLALMPPVDIIPSNRPQENMEDLYLSLCRLVRIRAALALLPLVGASLRASWDAVATVLLRLQYLGFFAGNAAEDDARVTHFVQAHGGADMPDGLCRNPRWVMTVQERRLEREAKQKRNSASGNSSNNGGGGGGGWLSSLWNGSDKNEPDALELALMEAEPRVRECIPDAWQLVDLLCDIPRTGRRRLGDALGAMCTSNTTQRDPVANLIERSYAFHMLCAVIEPYRLPNKRVLTSTTTMAEAHADTTGSLHDTEDGEGEDYGVLLSSARQLVASSLEMVKVQRDPALRSGMECLVRLSSAMLCTIQRQLLVRATRSLQAGPAGNDGATERATMKPSFAAVWSALQLMLPPEMPLAEFAELVSPLMVKSIANSYEATLNVYERASSNTTTAPSLETVPTRWLRPAAGSPLLFFAPCLTAIVLATPAPLVQIAHLDALVQWLSDVVGRCCYDVETQTDMLVVVAVSVRQLLQEYLASKRQTNDDLRNSVLSLGRTVPELVSRTARQLMRGEPATGDARSAVARCDQWLFALKGLCFLLACTDSPRDAIDTILVLQRTMLDAEANTMPASLVLQLYDELLLPLVEHVCGQGSTLVARPKVASEPTSEASLHCPNPSGRLAFTTEVSPKLTGAYDMRHRTISSVFSLGVTVPMATTVVPSAAPASLWGACATSTEVKCRLLNVLPKLLLQEAASLAVSSPDVLCALWQRVLGTLYAFCSSASSPSRGARESSGDAAQQIEAIEETVKNMVFVAASVFRVDAAPPSFDLNAFWHMTKQLIAPFSFSGPLIGMMASLVHREDGDGAVGGVKVPEGAVAPHGDAVHDGAAPADTELAAVPRENSAGTAPTYDADTGADADLGDPRMLV